MSRGHVEPARERPSSPATLVPDGYSVHLGFPKALANERKHGVSFEDALSVFLDPAARVFDDPAHSRVEHREIIVGHSAGGRLLPISFTERDDEVRLISARKATPRERHDHEENRTH